MYFWKTHLLVDSIKSGSLGDGDYKNYYLATSILTVVGVFIAIQGSHESSLAKVAETICVLAVTIFGINAAFAANGGTSGTRFVEKAVAISFPLLIKLFASAIAAGVVIGIWHGLGDEAGLVKWGGAVANVVLQTVFYWRLAVHVRHSNA